MNKKDMGVGVVSILFGIWMFITASGFKGQAGFWPKIIGGGIVVLGIIIFITGAMHKAEPSKKKCNYPAVLEVLVIILAYFFAFQYFSYVISTALLIIAVSFVLGYRNFKIMIPTAVITALVLYFAFTKLLNVRFTGIFM